MRRGCFRILALSAEGRGRTSGRLRRPSLYPPSLGLLAGHTCPRTARKDRTSARLRTRVLSPSAVCCCPFDLCRGACGHRARRRMATAPRCGIRLQGFQLAVERTRSRLHSAADFRFVHWHAWPHISPCLPVSPRIFPPNSVARASQAGALACVVGKPSSAKASPESESTSVACAGTRPGRVMDSTGRPSSEMCRDVPRCGRWRSWMCRCVRASVGH